MLDKVLSLILFVVLFVGFNTVAVLIITGKNPILGGGFNFFTRKWEVGRHKSNLGSKIFGYLFAGLVFLMDFWILFGHTTGSIK